MAGAIDERGSTGIPARPAGLEPATVSLEDQCVWSDSGGLGGRGRVVDGFTAAREIQERVAAGEAVEREVLRGLALAVLAGLRAGRIALAVLRAVSDEECLSWALELSDVVLADRDGAADCADKPGS